jgi:hypothetical protein
MATDIPNKEPETFRAGDTVKWKRSLDCYPASESWVSALDILNPNFERLAENMQKVKEEPESEDPNPVPSNLKQPKKPQPKARGGGFVDGWR